MRFVDTSFLVALRFARDGHHEEAATLWLAELQSLVTTNHVLGESWAFLRRRLGHERAWPFVNAALNSSKLTVHHVEENTEQAAWDWLARHDERPYSFVDATSFATMRRLRLTEALAFDGDFSAAGFIEVRPRSSALKPPQT